MTKKWTVAVLLATVGMAAVVGGAAAQSFGPEAREPLPPGSPGRAEQPPPGEDLARRIETMRMWALTKDMDLSPEESAKLFPILNRYDKQRAEMLRSAGGEFKKLRQLAAATGPDEKSLQETLERIDGWQEKLFQLQKQERKEIAAQLTPKRLAEFVLSSKRFEHRLHQVIGRVEERRGRGGSKGPDPGAGRRQPPGRGGMSGPGKEGLPPSPPGPPAEAGPDAGF